MVVKQRGGPPPKNAQHPGFAIDSGRLRAIASDSGRFREIPGDSGRFREIPGDFEGNQESPFLLINRYYDWTKPEYQVGGHTDHGKK